MQDNDLISRDAMIKKIKQIRARAKTLTGVDMVMLLEDAPAVDAAPLDKLCTLLAKNADCPPEHSPVQQQCKGNCAECWESVLKEWMEEQDATD